MPGDPERVRELKEIAKWGMDNEKKKAISALSHYGSEGVSAINEVLGVTAHADVKQACLEAIKSIGKAKSVRREQNRSNSRKRSIHKSRPTFKRKKTKVRSRA